jgi:alanine-glyoxylate transaminase/serine-glyoxylate transaminase/serine-pyruvate transaminase
MGLKLADVALAGSGVQSAMDFFAAHPQRAPLKAAA